jgi:hypothetical protein
MKTISTRETKSGFSLMIDTACDEPVLIEKRRHVLLWSSPWKMYERLSVRSERADKGPNGTKGASKGAQ